MELTLYRKNDQVDTQDLVVLLDKIMENAPTKVIAFKIGKTVTVDDNVGHAVMRNYPDLFSSEAKKPRREAKIMRKYEDKSIDLKTIVDADFP